MDKKTCTRCGSEITAEQGINCPACGVLIGSGKKKRYWYSIMAAGLLSIAGWTLWYANTGSWGFSRDAFMGRPVALINGEPLAGNDFKERMAVSRAMLERRYGKDVFAGERGKALLARLEGETLEGMLEERLVVQEAGRMGIQVSDARVRQELERIGGEIYGNQEKFQASLRESGISPQYLMNHIRYQFLCREIGKLKFASQADPDACFGAWLAQARGKADVTIYRQADLARNVSRSRGGCCGSGGAGDGCSGRRYSGGPVDPELQSKASASGLAEYRRTNPGDTGAGARVTDYGCHIQVDIEKGGKIVKSYTYRDGKAFEM